jgi:hypothetical protein
MSDVLLTVRVTQKISFRVVLCYLSMIVGIDIENTVDPLSDPKNPQDKTNINLRNEIVPIIN